MPYNRLIVNNEFKAYLNAGLSNRIRSLLAIMYICKINKWKLKIYWPINKVCDAHFLTVFNKLPGVNFIYFKADKNLEKTLDAIKWNFKGQYIFSGIIKDYFPNLSDKKIHQIELEYYSILQPIPRILKIINNIDKIYILNRCYSIHMRRTDHINFAKSEKKYTESIDFQNFINESPNKVYLSTDNKETQNKYFKLYPNKIIFYKNISNVNNFRQTSLEHAVIDIYICSKTRYFKPSGASSFSDFILILREINLKINKL